MSDERNADGQMPTPETDAAVQRCACSDYIIEPDFARNLENERDVLRKQLTEALGAVENLENLILNGTMAEVMEWRAGRLLTLKMMAKHGILIPRPEVVPPPVFIPQTTSGQSNE